MIEVLLVLMIVGAVIALEVKDLLSSVVAVGTVGLVLSLVFLLLQAPDVAITQLAVEIIAVILLIRATLRARLPGSPGVSRPVGFFVGACGAAALVALVWPGFAELPAFGFPEMRVAQRYLEQGLAETGAANLVAAVILDYRAYDTLGEATVLFTAVIGVLTVLRAQGRKAKEVRDER
ncbi:MAG: DUF4040 domain-containing protein [Acidobacteriota bacterium]